MPQCGLLTGQHCTVAACEPGRRPPRPCLPPDFNTMATHELKAWLLVRSIAPWVALPSGCASLHFTSRFTVHGARKGLMGRFGMKHGT